MGKSPSSVWVILAFFSIYVFWGSTYLMNKVAVQELDPLFLASCRFLTAGSLIFILARGMGISLKITKKQFKNTCIAGCLFLSLGNGFVVWALKYVDSGFAALEISAQPLIILFLMRILQGKKIKPMSMIGVLLGMLGIYLLVSQQQIIADEQSLIGMVMIFFCMFSWAYGSLFVAQADLPHNYFVNTGYQMLTAGITLAGMSLAFGEQWSQPFSWQWQTQWSLVLLVILGSIIAFTSFNYLLKAVSPEKVATSTYVNPIVALILGWYLLDEQITLQSIVAATILLTGVYFINTKKTLAIFERFKR